MVLVTPVSCAMICWVRRAMRADSSVGKASASSSEFVCKDWQPPRTAARACVAMQALAAVLGGCQSLHTNSLDEALALPTEESALIALRTQQIIAQETGVTNTIDPVAGSYAIEHLTGEIERRAEDYI